MEYLTGGKSIFDVMMVAVFCATAVVTLIAVGALIWLWKQGATPNKER